MRYQGGKERISKQVAEVLGGGRTSLTPSYHSSVAHVVLNQNLAVITE